MQGWGSCRVLREAEPWNITRIYYYYYYYFYAQGIADTEGDMLLIIIKMYCSRGTAPMSLVTCWQICPWRWRASHPKNGLKRFFFSARQNAVTETVPELGWYMRAFRLPCSCSSCWERAIAECGSASKVVNVNC